jgi:hypothetical protein
VNTANLTNEDIEIISSLHNARALNQGWDAADYRAMLARSKSINATPQQYVAGESFTGKLWREVWEQS